MTASSPISRFTWLKTVVLFFAGAAGGGFLEIQTVSAQDISFLVRIADGVVARSTRRLLDHSSGKTYEDSAGLAPKPELSVESKFNAWFYQTWLLADGMRRVSGVLPDSKYKNYGEANLDFFYKHLDFFQRQVDAGMQAAPCGDGKLSPVGCYFKIESLWQTGLAPLVAERYQATHDAKYEAFMRRVRQFLEQSPRFDDGSFYRPGKGMMTDDPYMTVPFLVREWNASGDAKTLDSAIAQVLGTHARLFDPGSKLLFHLWDLKTKQPAGVFWGRGNGWTQLAHVELLATIPKEHPLRAAVLKAFVAHMEGVRNCADPQGGWHQVLNHPESWLETSATGMLTYAMARGVNEGWLDASFEEVARKGWLALEKKVTQDNNLIDVCGSTDTGDLEFYLKRPRLQGDLHGFGSFLLAGAEVFRLPGVKNAGTPARQ